VYRSIPVLSLLMMWRWKSPFLVLQTQNAYLAVNVISLSL
jgi:hypothetical protein